LQGAREAVEAAAVGRAPEDLPVEALDGVLEALRGAKDRRGDLAPRGPVRKGRAKRRLAGRIDAAVEGVLVEGGQEAVVRAAAPALEVLRRAENARLHLLHRVALLEERHPAV